MMTRNLMLMLLALPVLAACAGSSKKADGVRRVDDLLDRIERVHVEVELSAERMHASLDALHAIATPDFAGDPFVAYAALAEAADFSEEQAEELRSSFERMEKTADKFYSRWEKDLEDFSSSDVRRRSRDRLEESRKRYSSIVSALEPARSGFEVFNITLQDHVAFLEHDLNAESLAMVRRAAKPLVEQAAELDAQFDRCLDAAQTYVQASALPGAVEVTQAGS